MCLHGLPGYCCAICNHAVRPAPDAFRRRAIDPVDMRIGPSTPEMRIAAADGRNGVRMDVPRSPWRQAQADRDFVRYLQARRGR